MHALARRGQVAGVQRVRGQSVSGPVTVGLALSPREQEVLSLLATGRSVPEIAGAMFVSLSTAKTYVSRVYEKLGAVNRANAIMIALGLGLITPKLPASA